MLHLKSSNASIPEFTLVLHDGAMAGWCADGRVWGPPYFVGDRKQSDPAEIYRGIVQAFAEQLT